LRESGHRFYDSNAETPDLKASLDDRRRVRRTAAAVRNLLAAGVLAAAWAPERLHADPAPPIKTLAPQQAEPPDHPRGARRPHLFVSPSGEPFRGPDGLGAWFAEADSDHDGAVTQAEFEADALRAFRLYDADADGVVDGFEIQAYERERVPEISEILLSGDEAGPRRRRGRRGKRGGGGDGGDGAGEPARTPGAGREGAARFSLLNEPEPLLAADADVDGKVSLAEWKRATARRFATLDKDRSGRLTLEKLRPPRSKT
jgi:hypothetical protein